MSADSKIGPLTIADLTAVWRSAVDPSYGDAFIAAGEGQGFEAYTQGFAQMARVSQAIDVSTQACFVLPWSGQSNPPASGPALAQVVLTFTRTKRLNEVLRIGAGLIYFDEQQNDWGIDGSVPVLTGRRYLLQNDLVFLPGDSTLTAVAFAEKPGYGYNNPRPGSIRVVEQPGSGFANIHASVTVATAPQIQVQLVTVNEPDTFIPQHVGQYVMFTQGANAGTDARIVDFAPPVPPLIGSTATLEDLVSFENFGTATGTFLVGEQVTITGSSTGTGVFVVQRTISPGTHQKYGFVLLTGSAVLGDTLTGVQSGAVAAMDLIYQNPTFTPEVSSGIPLTGGASWRVLDWVLDWGLTVTNILTPTGGLFGMLDGIGADKNLPRLTGEQDPAYRQRIWQIADVVTPNAIRRALIRILGPIPFCFREVGTSLLPGIFWDLDFYDYDVLVLAVNDVSPTTYPFIPNEPVVVRDVSGNVKVTGRWGRQDSGTQITIIRIDGEGTIANPYVNGPVGFTDNVLGLWSGVVFATNVTVATPYGPPYFANNPLGPLPWASHRFNIWLDTIDMRAMFLVGVQRVGGVQYGEFGFAWSAFPDPTPPNDPNAFFDGAPLLDFYDGFASLAVGPTGFYARIYNAIDKIRAGGVSFYLYIEDGSCI